MPAKTVRVLQIESPPNPNQKTFMAPSLTNLLSSRGTRDLTGNNARRYPMRATLPFRSLVPRDDKQSAGRAGEHKTNQDFYGSLFRYLLTIRDGRSFYVSLSG